MIRVGIDLHPVPVNDPQAQQDEYVTILTTFQHGRQVECRLAYNHQHGAWLEWLASGDNAPGHAYDD